MELRGQEKGIGMPNTLGYNQPNRDSSISKLQSSPTVGQASDIQPPQTHTVFHKLDHHLYPPNLPHQSNKPRKDPDPAITSPIATASVTSTPNSKPSSPPPPPPRATTSTTTIPSIRYRECLKNHAASMGSHVVDGCGEFMPSGEEVTPEALKCAACECHRNFHRKEIEGEPPQQYFPSKNYNITQTDNRIHSSHTQFPPPLYLHHQHHKFTTHGLTSTPSAGLIPPIMMTFGGGRSGGPAGSSSEDLNLFQSNVGGQTSVHPPLSKKRFRTKFSQEQKDKMMEFAEKLGWKIQKQDDQEVHQFCSEVGVKRQVFKVWMHNNKQAIKKKQL